MRFTTIFKSIHVSMFTPGKIQRAGQGVTDDKGITFG